MLTKIQSFLIVVVIISLFFSAIIDVNIIKYILSGIVIAYLIGEKNKKYIFGWCVILTICLFTQWGIGQFIVQHSFGLQIIGESIISDRINGVAKFGNGIVRGYGPFEHANIFGGVNLLGLILAIRLLKDTNNKTLRYLILFTFGLGIIASFSRTAITGSILLSLITIGLREFKKIGIVLFGIIILLQITFLPLLIIRANDSNDAAISERVRGYQWNNQLIISHSLWVGLGTSNYKMELKKFLDTSGIEYMPWEIDYVHSVPLLVTAQFGVLGGITAIVIMALVIKTISMRMSLIISSLLPTLLLDHYWITQTAAGIYLIVVITVLYQVSLIPSPLTRGVDVRHDTKPTLPLPCPPSP